MKNRMPVSPLYSKIGRKLSKRRIPSLLSMEFGMHRPSEFHRGRQGVVPRPFTHFCNSSSLQAGTKMQPKRQLPSACGVQ